MVTRLPPPPFPIVPSGSSRGVISETVSPYADVTWVKKILAAKLGPMTEDEIQISPTPPPWPSRINGPWINVTEMPGSVTGSGFVFDSLEPNRRGLEVDVFDVRQVFPGQGLPYIVADVFVQTHIWQQWLRGTEFWYAATKSSISPSNSTDRWVRIISDPSPGPTIGGKPTTRGRGIVYEQDGAQWSEVGRVNVWEVISGSSANRVRFGIMARLGDMIAKVSFVDDDGPNPFAPPRAIPVCDDQMMALYKRADSDMWPSDVGEYTCGFPYPNGDNGRFTQVKLGSGGSSGGPVTAPFSGELVKDPKGIVVRASLGPILGGSTQWVNITRQPNADGQHFGLGTLYRLVIADGLRVWRWKPVLVINYVGSQGVLTARIVDNGISFKEMPKGQEDQSSEVGLSPLSTPSATVRPSRLRRRRGPI